MSVIVSAFLANINQRSQIQKEGYPVLTVDDYLKNGKELLALPYKKIIFMDQDYIEYAGSIMHPNTTLVPITSKDLLFFNELIDKELSLPLYREPQKDTKEYMILMTNKSYFCKRATDIFTNEKDFLWLDFGISYIFPKLKIKHILHDKYVFNKIRIGGIWTNEIAKQYDIWNHINWFFAGTVFGGNVKEILRFHDFVDNEFRLNLEKNKIVWEVNLWYQIYLQCPDLFEIYQCNHNETLIKNL
jgi:hypothetical protein